MAPEQLKKIRTDRGLTQVQMEGLLGLKKHNGRTVRKFESGEIKPSG